MTWKKQSNEPCFQKSGTTHQSKPSSDLVEALGDGLLRLKHHSSAHRVERVVEPEK
jgi:hypothetical protein